MITGTISLGAAIDFISSGRSFDIEFVTADKVRKTGGELKAFSQAVKASDAAKGFKGAKLNTAEHKHVNPNHSEHDTVNIYAPRESKREARIVKVHYRLITRLNGFDVI